MILGYARVSINDQNFDVQPNPLKVAVAERAFAESINGKPMKRPELGELLEGEVVTVTKYDCPPWSLRGLLKIVEAIQQSGRRISFVCQGSRHDVIGRPIDLPCFRAYRTIRT